MRLTFLVPALLLAAASGFTPAAATAQGTTPGTTRQQVVVRQGPVSTSTGADTLVECVPVERPASKPAAPTAVRRRPRIRPRPRPAPAAVTPKPEVVAKPAPKPAAKPRVVTRRPRRRPVVAAASNAPKRANLPALVMCRPIHPVTPVAMGPLPETLVPIPEIAPAAPVAAAVPPIEEVPSYIAAAGPHSQFLPLALIPAFFIPFIHSGHHNTPGTPIDTTTPPPPPPPVDTAGPPPVGPPPVGPPPTTVPEPSSVALLGSGLLALGGFATARRRKKR